MIRRDIGMLLSVAAASAGRADAASQDHVPWVAEALMRMQTIKPGMTRADVLRVLTTEGGISTALHRTYVSRDCPYFKVDVDFKTAGRPDSDANGRGMPMEANEDIILRISIPYLEFAHGD